MTTAKVFLVDDHQMFRSGVRSELGEGIEVVVEADDVESAVQGIRATRPDLLPQPVAAPEHPSGYVAHAFALLNPRVRPRSSVWRAARRCGPPWPRSRGFRRPRR